MLEQLKKSDSLISNTERAAKLEEFGKLKERIAIITRKDELSQEEFDKYLNSLEAKESCKYSSGIKNIMSLCNNSLFKCEFRSNDKYKTGESTKFECKRERILKLKTIL